MFKMINRKSLQFAAAVYVGVAFGAQDANAAGGGNDFSQIAENITTSIASVPGMLTGLSYMLGILLGVLGVLKIKDHVENPSGAPLKEGAVRLAAGGGLFALPIVYEAMLNTVGADGDSDVQSELTAVEFAVGGP